MKFATVLRNARVLLITVSSLSTSLHLSAQAENDLTSVPSVLERMKSSNAATRSKAFDQATEIIASGRLTRAEDDRLELGIIQLLILENSKVNLSDAGLGRKEQGTGCGNPTDDCEGCEEGESEYYPSLIATVAGFNDERAIPALVGAMPYSSDAGGALLKFGPKAIQPILQQLKSPNALLRTSALNMAISLEGKDEAVSSARITEMLRTALRDPVAVVRSNAINEIVCRKNRLEFVPILENLAKTDPVHWQGRADDGVDGDQFYPVRHDARRALREIYNDQQCSWRR